VVAEAQKSKARNAGAEVMRLDREGNHVGIFEYLKSVKYENGEILHTLFQLFTDGRFQSSFIVAKLLTGAGVDNPVVDLARGVGGILFHNAIDESEGAERLARSIGRLAPDQLEQFRESVAGPAFRHIAMVEIARQGVGLEAKLAQLRRIVIPDSDKRVSSNRPAKVPGGTTKQNLWAPLVEELGRWAALGRVATFWWRDDDAVMPTPQLERLLAAAGSHPVSLAVIPGGLQPALAAWLGPGAHVSVLQHGWLHANHARQGAGDAVPFSEYPKSRPPGEVRRELMTGRSILLSQFGTRALPVFVPPWGHFDASFLSLFADCGITWLSDGRQGSASHRDTGWAARDRGVHVVTDGRDPPKQMVALLCDHLRVRRYGWIPNWEPTGILTHHKTQTEESYEFIADLLRVTDAHGSARWLHGREVFSTDTAITEHSGQGEAAESDLIAEILRLDREDKHIELFRSLQGSNFAINDVLYCLYRLATSGRFQSAFILAKMLTGAGVDNPAVDLARAVGGAIFGNTGDEADGVGRLAQSLRRLSPDQLKEFSASIAAPVFGHAMANEIAGRSRDVSAKLARLREIAIPEAKVALAPTVAADPGPRKTSRPAKRGKAR